MKNQYYEKILLYSLYHRKNIIIYIFIIKNIIFNIRKKIIVDQKL